MSTYRPAGRPHYLYDFQIRGRRFSGNTRCTTKREADAHEKRLRQEAAKEIAEQEELARGPMTFGVASTRYYEERGQHSENGAPIEWALAWLQEEIGMKTRVSSIDDNLVARLVAKRRAEINPRTGEVVRPSTVNRTVTEPLRRIMRRAATVWGVPVKHINWKEHLLKESKERVRELGPDEEKQLFEILRPDYHPLFRFALLSGCRLSECVNLRWEDIDFGGRQIWIRGKGGKVAPIPLPPFLRELLWAEKGNHPEFVFTYIAQQTQRGYVRGRRYPVTVTGIQSLFKLHLKKAIPDYHFHDNRHTAATRLLRASGNLRVAKELLRHSKVETTMRYAHVMQDDIMSAMERSHAAYGATENPTKSPDIDKPEEKNVV
jgi:integrase